MTDEDEVHPATLLEAIEGIVLETLDEIRLGVYDESQKGNLREVLEDIERILR